MVDSLNIEKFRDVAKVFIVDIIFSVENSHEKAFGDNRERDDLIAGVILNNAISASNSLKILYYQNPKFEHIEFDDFFRAFDVYKHELLTNIRTGHSHQWTDIQFRSFIEKSIPLTQLLEMDMVDTLTDYLSD